MLFYNNLIPVDRVQHASLTFKPQADGFRFAAATNALPLTVTEFAVAGHTYPIVFVPDQDGSGMALALAGLRTDENLFVKTDGSWDVGTDVGYIPGYVRRYPFILQADPDQQRFRVLIDDKAAGVGHPEGQPIFQPDGSNSAFMNDMMQLLDQYTTAAAQTADFVRHLRTLDLLIPREIAATTRGGEAVRMAGVHVVDEARLNALPDDALLKMVRNGYLAWIIAHLMSLTNIQVLLGRLEGRLAS